MECHAATPQNAMPLLRSILDQSLPADWPTQLPARVRPLRELWQARGPGFERQLAKHLAPRSVSVGSSNTRSGPIAAVYPLTGGFGRVLPDTHGILLEASLTDFDDRAPEIVRLAWLITLQRIEQLARTDAAHPGASLSADRRPLAALLISLALASDLEWLPVTLHTFERTLANWIGLKPDEAKRKATEMNEAWNRLKLEEWPHVVAALGP